jgi:multiple sugar transport system ATP-binding protein
MAEVKLDSVTKVFPGDARAVDALSLTVHDGEFLVLVGPSGCGKSTVLRIIAGLEDATEGVVAIDGTVVDDLRPKERDVAMVFQNYALYPHMTVAENLGFALRLRGTARDEIKRQVAETAAMLGLDDLLDRKPKALSGGQRQRVAMGRAIVRRPRVFLMDEPLSNLDAKLRVSMRAELSRLHRRFGTTTIYVTHDQVEAMTLGDRIAVLDKGRLQQVGTPEDLYVRPRNLFVASFMGSPAINLVEVGVRPDPPAVCIVDDSWPLQPAQTARLDGRELVVLGLRPDAFRWPAPADLPSVTVTALGVESLGDERHVLFQALGPVPAAQRTADTPESLWTAKVGADCHVGVNERITLGVDLDRAYFFDAATGLAVVSTEPAVEPSRSTR